MSHILSYSVNLQVTGGPSSTLAQTLNVEAYDKIDVTVPEAAGQLNVDVQPGGAGKVQCLFITASSYNPPLTYKVDAGENTFSLDAPLMLVGAGAVAMLGASQKVFLFTNTSQTIPVELSIIVGRKAA